MAVTTRVDVEVLRAALRRNGVWFVNLHGQATNFFHRRCFTKVTFSTIEEK